MRHLIRFAQRIWSNEPAFLAGWMLLVAPFVSRMVIHDETALGRVIAWFDGFAHSLLLLLGVTVIFNIVLRHVIEIRSFLPREHIIQADESTRRIATTVAAIFTSALRKEWSEHQKREDLL